ncbi:MAG TPA: Sua5/YciO/YrdC/YwlC family protein, partial [Phnomibacter sp.]|nr:Sua5/YciO/YrdC/YwlC family protein [Phnomibacter sp.]
MDVFETEIGTQVSEAALWLMQQQLVAIPTETVYGLAGNALSPEAVLRIFEAKMRPRFNPLIMHLPDRAALNQYVTELPNTARRLMDAFCPGPLTF